MDHLRMFFTGYQGFVMQLLASLGGPWGILFVGLIDAAAFGIPLDPVVAYSVYHDPGRAFLYVLMVSIGSVAGATVPYLLGRRGGEKFVLKRVGEDRFRRIHSLVERFGVFALFIPAILPPPTPFKLFEFCAGAAGLRYPRFAAAVFCGRMVRFSMVALLSLRFGRYAMELVPALTRFPWRALLVAGVTAVCCWLVVKLWASYRNRATRKMTRPLTPVLRSDGGVTG